VFGKTKNEMRRASVAVMSPTDVPAKPLSVIPVDVLSIAV